ncbi:MAG TPA: ComEA family DNA-binding protein [Solirubrobacterales bacterium]|nr:ComEA family DNA-binding protein [Solirubrobacterales bacterium]
MPNLSRSQLLVYGAVGVALLLVGARWIRSADARDAASSGIEYSSGSGGSSSDSASFGVDAQGGGDLVVDVAGAVGRPGVYRLPAGSRVTDAVQRAGGATRKAEVDSINLAARLTDGQQVVVPAAVAPGASAVSSGATSTGEPTGPVSLGTATLDQLDTIEGIGPVTAQKIVEFRDQHGGVSSVDQLDQIDGIGPATMEALRARIQP